MNANSAIPLYKQIVRYLDTQIKAGIYGPGDKLPTENELMEKFGVSRITVRSAVKELEDAGIVVRVRAKGTFVSSDRVCRGRSRTLQLFVPDGGKRAFHKAAIS